MLAIPFVILTSCSDMDLRNILAQTVENAKSPQAPSGLSVAMLSVSMLHLTWTDNSANETGFKVERSPDGTSGWTLVRDAAANTTSWNDSGLTPGTTYYYRVKAYTGMGDSTYSNAAFIATDTLKPITTITIGIGDNPTFTMGEPNVDENISSSYNASKYEITNAEFAQFIADGGYSTQSYWTANGLAWKGSTIQPGYWTDINFNGSNQPVVGVSWYEAAAFCNWRSAKEGLTPAYNGSGQATLSANGYRLPTEVEWEYAAAKGASGQAERTYAYGSGTFDPSKVVCSVSPASATQTADVGSKSTAGDTPQGMTDMSGNVWEWCSDNYQADGSITTPSTDRYYFVDDSTSQAFLLRGGAWYRANEGYFRCAYRGYLNTNVRDYGIGFRVVRR